MELHYKATVDDEEWEVSSITVNKEWKLKDLKTAIISANEWVEKSTVSFFRHESSKRVPLTTGVQRILDGNTEEKPLNLIVVQSARSAWVGHPPTPKGNFPDVELIQKRSTQIIDQWMQELPELPAHEQLAHIVVEPLPCAIPSHYYSLVNPDDLPATDVLERKADGDASVDNFLESLRTCIWEMQRVGTSEDTVHPIVEMLVLIPMRRLAKHCNVDLRTDRNTVDSSGATMKTLRPDVLCWLPSGILAFKGEEKATSDGLGEATDELSSKLALFTDTFFGKIPFQLCYALGGEQIRFFALVRKTAGQHDRIPLTEVTNLATPRGRSLCIRYVVNITRILMKMYHHYPQASVICLGGVIRTRGSEVTILGDKVRKRTIYFTGDMLGDLYESLKKARGIPGLPYIETYKFARDGGTLTLQLGPVGYCNARPQSIDEVKEAGRQILLALSYLHDLNWIHRDLRPPNVMLSNGQWFLIDLEWADHAGKPIDRFNPQTEWTPPEITGEGCRWTPLSDMWQFGTLLQIWGFLDNDGTKFVQTQLNRKPECRLNAKESLEHDFFKPRVP